MAINFEKYAAKGNEFIHILAEKLGNRDDEGRAGRVLRCVLRALRSHLTTYESMHLLAQLPMALKGIYVDGWKPDLHVQRVRSVRDFADEVMQQDGGAAERDFEDREDAVKAIRAFIETLQLYVSHEQLEDAFGTLPEELKKTFTGWLEKTDA